MLKFTFFTQHDSRSDLYNMDWKRMTKSRVSHGGCHIVLASIAYGRPSVPELAAELRFLKINLRL